MAYRTLACPAMSTVRYLQAKELLGWEPKVSLREGLASMVDDFKRRLHVVEK